MPTVKTANDLRWAWVLAIIDIIFSSLKMASLNAECAWSSLSFKGSLICA